MKLKTISDENLHATNHLLATRERALLKEIIDHLRETERRRLFAKYGYSSLFEYVTKELKCCAGSAQIRIDAMRFAVDVPEVRDKLARGDVSLSTVATLQKFVRNEKKYKSEIYTRDQKKELFAMAVGKSRRETEAELARISPQSVPRREEIRPISASENKMTLIITDELLKKIERLKEVLPEGHGNTMVDIIDKSVSMALRKFDPLLKRKRKNARSRCSQNHNHKLKIPLHQMKRETENAPTFPFQSSKSFTSQTNLDARSSVALLENAAMKLILCK